MKKLLLAPLALALVSCQGSEALCKRVGFIPVVEAPTDAPETAANKYDTPATVKRVELHNRVVEGACGALPVQADG